MQKRIIVILIILLVAVVADAALLKTIPKAKVGVMQAAAEALTKEDSSPKEEEKVTPKVVLAAAKAVRKKQEESQPGSCARVGEHPSENRHCCPLLRTTGTPPVCTAPDTSCRQAGEPYSITRYRCCEGLKFDETTMECNPRKSTKKKQASVRSDCAQQGEPAMLVVDGEIRGCCPGLSAVNLVCTKTCSTEGETPTSRFPCCLTLRSVGTPPVCTAPDTSCRQEGESYSIFRRNCCEGLEFDEATFECKPRRGMGRMPSLKGEKGGCTAEQLTRIEQKLDELLSRR